MRAVTENGVTLAPFEKGEFLTVHQVKANPNRRVSFCFTQLIGTALRSDAALPHVEVVKPNRGARSREPQAKLCRGFPSGFRQYSLRCTTIFLNLRKLNFYYV